MNSPWGDTQVERLKELDAAGVSATKIAAILNEETGSTFTRNAVIGKIDRLGIRADRPSRRNSGNGLIGEAKARKPRQRTKPKPPPAPPAVKPKAPPVARLDFVPANPAPLIELRANRCRYPLGKWNEPAHLFCGEPGYPWCPHHRAVVSDQSLRRRAA